MKKRLVQALIASVVMSSLIITPSLAAPTVDELEDKKAAAEGELGSLQEQLNTLILGMKNVEVKLNNTNEKLEAAKDDLKKAEKKEEKQYEDMKLRIKYMYEAGNADALEKFASSGTISEALSQLEYVEKVHTYDRDMLTEYEETVKEVEELKMTLEEDKKELEDLQTEYEEDKETLNTTIADKQDEISGLEGMLQEAVEAALEEQRRAAAAAAAEAAASGGGNSGGGSWGGNSGGGNTVAPPSYNVVTGNAVVDRAYQWLGKADYVWGACSPGAFDCSGFVSYCLTGNYARLGTTGTFIGWPQVSDPQPGDVCVIHEEYGSQHTGIYIGGGRMIHAATFGVGVIEGPVQAGMIYVRYPY